MPRARLKPAAEQVVVVTGATPGTGLAIAERFASAAAAGMPRVAASSTLVAAELDVGHRIEAGRAGREERVRRRTTKTRWRRAASSRPRRSLSRCRGRAGSAGSSCHGVGQAPPALPVTPSGAPPEASAVMITWADAERAAPLFPTRAAGAIPPGWHRDL